MIKGDWGWYVKGQQHMSQLSIFNRLWSAGSAIPFQGRLPHQFQPALEQPKRGSDLAEAPKPFQKKWLIVVLCGWRLQMH